MTYVIAVSLLKGGVGKSTTAVAIAEAGASSARVTLVDCDPQGSLRDWADLAEASGRPLRSAVTGVTRAADLAERLRTASLGADLAVLDSPPPGDPVLAEEVIAAADYVVMPVPPQRQCLVRVRPTLEIARKHGKPVRAALTFVRGGLAERFAAIRALTQAGVPVFGAELPLTVTVERNYGQVPYGVLARYGYQIMNEILREVQQNA